MTHEQFQDKQINELTQLMFELRNGKEDDFDGLLNLKIVLEQAVEQNDVNMIEVGNALSSAKAGNTALADEIRDRLDERLQEFSVVEDLDEEDIAYIQDDDFQVMENGAEVYLNVYVVLEDDTLEDLAEKIGMLEKAGVSDYEGLQNAGVPIDVYANIDDHCNVSLVLVQDGQETTYSNLPKEFAEAVVEQTEKMLEEKGSSIQQEFAEHFKDKTEFEIFCG